MNLWLFPAIEGFCPAGVAVVDFVMQELGWGIVPCRNWDMLFLVGNEMGAVLRGLVLGLFVLQVFRMLLYIRQRWYESFYSALRRMACTTEVHSWGPTFFCFRKEESHP